MLPYCRVISKAIRIVKKNALLSFIIATSKKKASKTVKDDFLYLLFSSIEACNYRPITLFANEAAIHSAANKSGSTQFFNVIFYFCLLAKTVKLNKFDMKRFSIQNQTVDPIAHVLKE